MRVIKYLSPSSVNQFYKSREEFYLSRITETSPPRIPQTKPMSVGSAFDAFVKNYLVKCLYDVVPAEFELDTILETQVEEQNRVWAREYGHHIFTQYKHSGALAKLMTELEQASDKPRFEFTVERRIAHETAVAGVPLLGKPDVFFINKHGIPVILDWKCNGMVAKTKTSPRSGYVYGVDGWDHSKKVPSKNHGQAHFKAMPMLVDGLVINALQKLEEVNQEWAGQLAIYLWVLGQPVGSGAVIGIEQLCGQGPESNGFSDVFIAQHRNKIGEQFQLDWFTKIFRAWEIIQSGHYFDELSRADSDAKCEQLDHYWEAFKGENPNQEWYNKMMGRSAE